MPRRRPRLLAPALVLALAAGVSGCGGGTKAAAPAQEQTSPAPSTPKQNYWPLTGLPLRGALPTHPPVAVKIDNTESSQPQIGLAKADLITEELVEGGLTRLAVFFDTTIPRLVGPVRSMRASDIGLVKPVKGVVVTSGAAPATIARLRNAKVNFKSNDAGARGFYRATDRTAPYNLMMRLPELVRTLKKPAQLSSPYLQWGSASSFAGTVPAAGLSAVFGAGHTTQWAYRGGHYVNTNSNAEAGRGFLADTVVVVRVTTKDAGYTDPAGNYVPESVTTGTGRATVFHGGKALTATWTKTGPTKPFTFRTPQGAAVPIPAGHTFIEVLPRDDRGGRLSIGG